MLLAKTTQKLEEFNLLLLLLLLGCVCPLQLSSGVCCWCCWWELG
jgi:hypothetical protein